MVESIDELRQYRGQAVCVLASGDPLCYGIGATLARHFPLAEMTILPAPSAFSLACARLGWPLADIDTASLCGRDPALLNALVYPGARLLVLSADRHTPAQVARGLCERGWGSSELTVLERLGGPHERQVSGIANQWSAPELADLNLIALVCRPDSPQAVAAASRRPGLPDSAYCHDGQLTKREVRAITLSTLAPLPGQLLWDVGAGCGSIAIEWMRSDRRCRAIAIESHPVRLSMLANNAIALGVPNLEAIAGRAPGALESLPSPDAIFIGGGLTTPGVLETCWQGLRSGGRLVANAVTVESEQLMLQWQQKLGGELTRVAIQRAEPLGKFLGWKALAPITQWAIIKEEGVS